jgi:hypothetical protein
MTDPEYRFAHQLAPSTISFRGARGELALEIGDRDGELAITVPEGVRVDDAARAVFEALRPMLAQLTPREVK